MQGPTHDDASLPIGCAAGSQVRGDASDSSFAWIVDFSDGYADLFLRDLSFAFVRAVRSVPAGQ